MLEEDTKILQEKRNVPESAFKIHFPDVYKRVKEAVEPLSITRWNEAKYIYMKQLQTLPTCKICGDKVDFISANKGYKATCSRKCDLTLKSLKNIEARDAKQAKC